VTTFDEVYESTFSEIHHAEHSKLQP